MKLKMDYQGHAVLQDSKPVYIHDDGKEIPFDVQATVQSISRLNGEAKSHRERAEAAEKALKAFDGITDPAAAIKALSVVSNLDQKKLIDSGEVEKVKAEISKAFEAQLKDATTKNQQLEQQLYSEKIGGSFSRSKLIADKLAIPSDLVQARFGNLFKIEEGKTVAYDQSGNKIYSRARPGELADFDEALETIIDQYPYKDSILKSTGSTGTGSSPSSGGSGQKIIKLSDLNAMRPKERAEAMKNGAKVID